jgi:type II secretion system protein N
MTLAFAIGPRARRILKIVGYVVLGMVTFVYGLHLTFPYDRVKDKGVEALSSRYDVSVGSVERGWLPGDFSMVNVILRIRPAKPGEIAKVIKIDRLDVDIGILSMIGGKVDVGIDAKLGPGSIRGTVSISKARLVVAMASKNLSLSDVPGLASIIGMPMGGRGNVTARLDLPGGDWRKANGRLSIECPSCTVGGDGAFFKPKNTNARTEGFVGKGVPVPLIAITNLSAQWTVGKGKITTDKFSFVSPHLRLELEFEATLEKELTKSKVDSACLRYRGTDELKTLDVKFYDALELTGGPLGADDLRYLKLVGTLGSFRAQAKPCGGSGGAVEGTGTDVAGDGTRTHTRPTLNNLPTPTEGGSGSATGTAAAGGEGEPSRQIDAGPTPGVAPDNEAAVGKNDIRPEGEVVPQNGPQPGNMEQTYDAAPEPAPAPPTRLDEVPAQDTMPQGGLYDSAGGPNGTPPPPPPPPPENE